MVKLYRSTVLDAPADRVWRDLRDFNGLPNWHPSVALSRIEKGHAADKVGCVRYYQLKDGGRFREQLMSLSDYDYTYTSAVLESPVEIEDHMATLRLFPVTEGNRCFVEWSVEFECPPAKEAELTELIGRDLIQTGFDALKRRYGRT
jgi:uncharacterized protein YndB with AHSA1/START domain